MARSDPSASPSGFSWVLSRNFCSRRRTFAAAARSFVWRELIDELGHANAPFDRGIVVKRQLRGPLQAQLARDPRLQDAMGALERLHTPALRPLGPEHADEDPRMAEIGRRLDTGHRDEPDPRVLELPDPFGHDL